jgi:hypothetical protein
MFRYGAIIGCEVVSAELECSFQNSKDPQKLATLNKEDPKPGLAVEYAMRSACRRSVAALRRRRLVVFILCCERVSLIRLAEENRSIHSRVFKRNTFSEFFDTYS